jgi:hypothetical protein
MGQEVGEVILDMAEANARLDPVLRPQWDAWLHDTVDVLRTQPDPGEPPGDYPERLAAAAARPLPLAVPA